MFGLFALIAGNWPVIIAIVIAALALWKAVAKATPTLEDDKIEAAVEAALKGAGVIK